MRRLYRGIGVIDDGLYGVDATIFDQDQSVDELVALAGTLGLERTGRRTVSRWEVSCSAFPMWTPAI